MEPRQYLSASPIQIGSVYYEEATQDDRVADTIEITWSGGAQGTQLTDLVIDTDKAGNGLTIGDCLFDTAGGGVGAYGFQPLQIVSQSGIDKVEFKVVDGGTRLAFRFTGFDAGERLVFTIDVDEMGFLGPNAVAEGNEWEGTKMTATFAATHYLEAVGSDIYVDFYNAKLTQSGLALPPDDYVPPGITPSPVFTAGAVFSLEQTPLPITLSGTVFEDYNRNNIQDSGDPGIAGVTLTLYSLQGTQYGATGLTTVTDANGHYRFDGLQPGTYRVAETQPNGYLSIGARPGTVAGETRGLVTDVDTLSNIPLEGGDKSIRNDFAEARPAKLSGRVYVDLNNNGVFDASEKPLAGVTVYLLDASGTRLATATTGADGAYVFDKLLPGTYGVQEVQPSGYLDGKDTLGTAGGELDGNDRMKLINLVSGANGEEYDFGELLPARISGYVFVDLPVVTYDEGTQPPDPIELLKTRDGVFGPEDKPLGGVVVRLGDANGVPVLDAQDRPITTVTRADGYYEFNNLLPGVYTVIEEDPAGYFDGMNTAGTKGGVAINALTVQEDPTIMVGLAFDASEQAIIRIVLQAGDAGERYNFSELLVEEIPTPPEPPTPPIPPPPPPPSPPSIPPPTQPYFPESLLPVSLFSRGVGSQDLVPLYGGGGYEIEYTWHLSVINAGRPREDQEKGDLIAGPEESYFSPVSWNGSELSGAQWILADTEGNSVIRYVFGMPGATPVVGDWNGEGTTKLGVFFDGFWFLDLNGDGRWGKEDLWARLGQIGDRPVAGDWDADGKTDIGIFGPAWNGDRRAIRAEPGLPDVSNRVAADIRARYKNIPPDPHQATSGWRTLKRTSFGKFRKDLIDHVFLFGDQNCVPVVGDWNGDGVSNIGFFHDGKWYLDADGDGRWSAGDVEITLGQASDVPVVGDWNGDGRSKVGVYRNGTWLLDTNGDNAVDARDRVFRLGEPGDVPVTGDWNGDGVDEIGVYRAGTPAAAKQASAQPAPSTGPQSAEPAIKR
jgi:protocatechuate 3,4-dioxygenase beta subunit